MLIQTTESGRNVQGVTRLEKALLEGAIEPINMLDLVEHCSKARSTQFRPNRIAEVVTKMESHGYVKITKQ